jgi:HD-like signal output (HDOD) protein
LLRIANSAAFGQAEHVASIDDAAALIGFREIHRLVGAVAVDQFSQRNYPLYGFIGQRARENGLYIALLMEELAKPAKQDPQIAYTVGLFRSVGKLTLEKLAEEKGSVAPYKPDSGQDLVLWEKHSFGISANEATAAILRQWHFPNEISHAIASHYLPAQTDEPLAQLLNLASEIVTRLGYGLPGESRYWLSQDEALGRVGIDERQCERCRDRAATAFERWSRAVA